MEKLWLYLSLSLWNSQDGCLVASDDFKWKLAKFLHETTYHVRDKSVALLNQDWSGNSKRLAEVIFRSCVTNQQRKPEKNHKGGT